MSGTTCTCGAGCLTYGAHLRRKNIGYAAASGSSEQKKWDAEIRAYRAARKQGVQPATTRMPDIQVAMEISERNGKAFNASDASGLLQ